MRCPVRLHARSLAVLLVIGCSASALARRPASDECEAGRFVTATGSPPLLPRVSPALDAVAVAGGAVSLDGCGAATHARVRGIRVVAKWNRCGAFAKVRLVARLQGCDAMAGTIRARRLRKARFSTTRSRCGDARVDAVAGEACDTTDTCGSGRHCFACACLAPTGACTTTVVPTTPASHVPAGTAVAWADDPPASGASYPVWARYLAYSEVIPRGYWVHDLENGGVVVLHGNDVDIAAVQTLHAVYQAVPVEPACGHRRALLTPDPLLDAPFAAVAWGVVLRCDAVDPAAIVDFVVAHRGQGPAPTCADGTYP